MQLGTLITFCLLLLLILLYFGLQVRRFRRSVSVAEARVRALAGAIAAILIVGGFILGSVAVPAQTWGIATMSLGGLAGALVALVLARPVRRWIIRHCGYVPEDLI